MPTEKFKALVHYIIHQCREIDAAQLNEMLWRADVLYYKRTGESITGERYLKEQEPYYTDADFARDLAAIYASLSERQERLGREFEAAIFDDLDSLYES